MRYWIISILCIVMITSCNNSGKSTTAGEFDMEPGFDVGVSACFGTLMGDTFIVAGGCNFPEKPLDADSQKKYYQGIYAASPSDLKWQRVGSLPEPMAYGVSVPTSEGVVLIGGTTADRAMADVMLLNIDYSLSLLPPLPFTLDNAAGTSVGNSIYVAGGNADGKPSRQLLMLDLDDLEAGWSVIGEMPGNCRVQPIMAASKNAKGDDCLYVFGGFAPRTEQAEPTLELDGLCYNLNEREWTAVDGPTVDGEKISLGGGVAVPLPDGKIVVCGGVNKDIFLDALTCQAPDYLTHDIYWYRLNQYLFMFDPVHESWRVVRKSKDTARAGALAVPAGDNSFYLIGGELKPRIRTNSVIKVDVE